MRLRNRQPKRITVPYDVDCFKAGDRVDVTLLFALYQKAADTRDDLANDVDSLTEQIDELKNEIDNLHYQIECDYKPVSEYERTGLRPGDFA